MGCQGSKAADVNASSEQPVKTLLAIDGSSKEPAGKVEGLAPSHMKEVDSTGASMGAVSSVRGNAVHNKGQGGRHMRMHPMLCTTRHELDVVVSQFTSHDSKVGNALGRNCKDVQWKVMYDIDQDPISIALHVQEHKLHYNEVRVECNGKPIFCGAGSQAKGKMTEDFYYQWPLRGAIRGINEINCFELRPFHCNSEEWFPATITGQRDDGFFEVTAQQLDARGYLRTVKYPAVDKADLREANSRRPLVVPEQCLVLYVPKQDPLKAVLSVDGEAITHHFGRPSPASRANGMTSGLQLQVSQDRSRVTSNVGCSTLAHFVSGEVRCVKSEVDRLMHSWTVQCGPFAEHSVKIVKNYTLGKVITLLVDGEVFVESSASDMGCKDNGWQCHFRFVGERVLDFEVFKTNMDGFALGETDHVEEKRKYVHECSVIIPNDRDLRSAQLLIDGQDFRELPVMKPLHQEPPLSMAPSAMTRSVGITVPYKVDDVASSGVAGLTNHLLAQAENSKKVASGFFAWCFGSSAAPATVETIPSERESRALRIVESPTVSYI